MADIVLKAGNKKTYLSPALLGLAITYMFFTISDLQTSRLTGNLGTERGIAHIALLLLTGYLLLFQLTHLRRLPKRTTLFALIGLAAWIFFTGLINGAEVWTFLVQMNMSLLWVLCYLFFYEYAKRNPPSQILIKHFCLFLQLFYLVATLYYSVYTSKVFGRIAVLNVSYYGMVLLPWVIFEANEKKRKFCYAMAIATAFVAMKRGAILSLPMMYIAEAIAGRKPGDDLVRKVGRTILLCAVFVTVFLIADYYTGGFITTRFSSSELADGSGRAESYALTIQALKKENFLQLLIGGGPGASIKLLGSGVHNEWLEMLFSFGIIGLLIYSIFILSIIRTVFRARKNAPEYAGPCAMMVALYLLLSMISTGYGGYTGVLIFGFWGYLEAQIDKKEEHNVERKECRNFNII